MANIPECCRDYDCEQNYPKCKKDCLHYTAYELARMAEREKMKRAAESERIYSGYFSQKVALSKYSQSAPKSLKHKS